MKPVLTEEDRKEFESQFTLLKKGEPAWDVMVIKDWAAFYDSVESLVERKLEEQSKKVEVGLERGLLQGDITDRRGLDRILEHLKD